MVCYGYLDDDTRIPVEFLCYSCLAKAGTGDTLLNSEREGEVEKALTDLQSLALFRRGENSFKFFHESLLILYRSYLQS